MSRAIKSTCRGCRRLVRWARTRRGKWIPLDLDPHPDGNVLLDEAANTCEVLSQKRRLKHDVLYKSHFATCSRAGTFRRR